MRNVGLVLLILASAGRACGRGDLSVVPYLVLDPRASGVTYLDSAGQPAFDVIARWPYVGPGISLDYAPLDPLHIRVDLAEIRVSVRSSPDIVILPAAGAQVEYEPFPGWRVCPTIWAAGSTSVFRWRTFDPEVTYVTPVYDLRAGLGCSVDLTSRAQLLLNVGLYSSEVRSYVDPVAGPYQETTVAIDVPQARVGVRLQLN